MAIKQLSVVITTHNESQSIYALLESLNNQTTSPNEIVIVDAASEDDTLRQIRLWEKKNKQIQLQLIAKKKINRSEGRNLGIKNARNDLIALVDAGCVADRHWIEQLVLKKTPGVGAVAGFYRVRFASTLQQVFGWYMATDPKTFDPKTYLPSSRSLLVTKQAWKQVGGYPEDLNTCEDLVFAKRLKDTVQLHATDKAFVYWSVPENLHKFFVAMYGYAQGDFLAKYKPHLMRIGSVYLRYVILFFLPTLIPVYVLFIWFKHRQRMESVKHLAYLPIVQLVADMAVMLGTISGLIMKIKSRFG
jgi:glycosyltransferase involved in cell wall biosynthesis